MQAKAKSSLFSPLTSLFSTSTSSSTTPPPVPSSKAINTPATQYNKVVTGESFEGERALVADTFSSERLDKMHRLARDHQNALSASDIIDLRKVGVTINKSLVADYSKYASLKQQAGESSEDFLKWLNVKTGPSMAEAPSMFVLQQTQPGKAVNKVEIQNFGPSGVHYEAPHMDSKTEDSGASGGDDIGVAAAKKKGDNLEGSQLILENEALVRRRQQRRALGAKNNNTKPTASAARAVSMNMGDADAQMEATALIHKAADALIDKQKIIDNHQRDAEKHADLADRAADELLSRQRKIDEHQSQMETQTTLVNQAADTIEKNQKDLHTYQSQMETIKNHIKSTTSTRALMGAGRVADHVHSLCKQLMSEREKNEALMAQSVDGKVCTESASSSPPLLRKALDSLSLLNEQKKQLQAKVSELTSDNDMYDRDMKDMQANLDHYKKTLNTLSGQNMDLKKMASREEYEKEVHKSRAADLSQKLASTLHFFGTAEDGTGNAAVFLKATPTACDCEEFDQMAARNEVEGALLVGSTQAMLDKCRVGERMRMEIHNCSGLTDKSGNPVDAVDVERMTDRDDDDVRKAKHKRGRLLDTLMLGKHTIQSEMVVTGDKQDFYALTLNAK